MSPRISSAATLVAVGLLTSTSAQSGRVARIGVSFPQGLQSGLATLTDHLTTQRLVMPGADGRHRPQLAESWLRSDDGREWTFTLQPELRFHDGSVATTETVAELIRAVSSDPQELRDYPNLRDVVSVRPAGERNVVVRTRNARVLLLDDLGGISLRGQAPGRRLGPYLIDSLSDESADLRAFEHYFKGRAPIDRVQLRSFHSQRSAWAALMRGEIDALHEISRVAAEFAEQGKRVRTYPVLRPYVAGIAFNVRREPFRDPAVRQALSLAVDRAAIVRMAYRGRARAAHGPLWPDHWTLSRDPLAAYDPRAAATRLAKLPLRPASDTGMSARLTFRCLVIPALETQPFERIALLLQRQFYDLGVDMQFEPVTVREFFGRVVSGDFDAVLNEFLGFTPTWISRIWRSPMPGGTPLMNTGYTAADEALDAMQLATSEDELKRAVAAVYQKMHDDPPAIFVAWPEVARAVTTDFDVPLERGTDIMGANIWFWRPASAERRASVR